MPPIPPPPPPGPRPVAFYDTECFPNYWLLKLRPRGGAVYDFMLRSGQSFDAATIWRIELLFKAYTTVSFNGIYYDVPMITGALSGYSCEQLKWLNDQLIPKQIKGQPKVQGLKPWELNLPEWQPADHIDVMQVAPGAGSQNAYAGRIHYKTMQDLPYSPDHVLADHEIIDVDIKCENDLGKLEAIFDALAPQLRQREHVGKKYGIDLRSKSDAQMAEAVLKLRCEQATGQRIYKPQIDWNLKFRCEVPDFVAFEDPQLRYALELVKAAVFRIRPPASMRGENDEKGKCIVMPPELESLEIKLGSSVYKMGIGGLHSQEKKLVAVSNDTHLVRMPDVASYYPNLMVNAGAWPPALGPSFIGEFDTIKRDRLKAKALAKKLKTSGRAFTDKTELVTSVVNSEDGVKALTRTVQVPTPEYEDASTEDGGGKIMINGTFGKTGSPYSVLWAPEMLIRTTVPGQLSLLMLIEWHERYGIPVVSANTDGIVINCPRDRLHVSDALIKEWEHRTGLEMETEDYLAIYARDVNNYFAIKTPDDVKRKGEYAKGGLKEKKNPDVEICSDAVSDYLAKGIPLEYTIAACRDVRKFVTIQAVSGGGVKLWGEGPRKGALVRDMAATLVANGWMKDGRKWRKGDHVASPQEAYESCFAPQHPEYLGKVVRWYYSTQAPGPIVYASNSNTVSLSYGARPCMTLPDDLPDDIDYDWYIKKAQHILVDIGK